MCTVAAHDGKELRPFQFEQLAVEQSLEKSTLRRSAKVNTRARNTMQLVEREQQDPVSVRARLRPTPFAASSSDKFSGFPRNSGRFAILRPDVILSLFRSRDIFAARTGTSCRTRWVRCGR